MLEFVKKDEEHKILKMAFNPNLMNLNKIYMYL